MSVHKISTLLVNCVFVLDIIYNVKRKLVINKRSKAVYKIPRNTITIIFPNASGVSGPNYNIIMKIWGLYFCMKTSPSPGAAMFCIVVQAGPAPAQSHMTCCQVPEKSNNVRNSLIRYTWLQLQSLGLREKFCTDWSTLVPKGWGGHWVRHEGQGINMPMQTQACTHTHASYIHTIHNHSVEHILHTHTHKRQRSSL